MTQSCDQFQVNFKSNVLFNILTSALVAQVDQITTGNLL